MIDHENGADAGKQTAPVLDQDEGEQRDEEGKGVLRDLFPDDGRGQIEDALHQVFHHGLPAGRDELRFFDGETNDDDEHRGDDPAGHHAVGHRQRADLKQRLGGRSHAMRLSGKGREGGGDKNGGQSEFFDSKHGFRKQEWPNEKKTERRPPQPPSTPEMLLPQAKTKN